MECSRRLLQTSKDSMDIQNNEKFTSSDGNRYIITLQCPSCRGGFTVDIVDILLLREHEAQMMKSRRLENIPDNELNAAELRQKYSFNNNHQDDSRISLLRGALQRYNKASGNEKKSTNTIKSESDSVSTSSSASTAKINNGRSSTLESKKDQERAPKSRSGSGSRVHVTQVPDIISQRIQYTNSKLFQGMEAYMTPSEQSFISSLFTQGSPEQLSQGAHILASIVEMNLLRSEQVGTTTTVPNTSTSAGSNPNKEQQLPPSIPMTGRISSTASTGAGGGTDALQNRSTGPKVPRSNQLMVQQAKMKREAAIRRKWDNKYPLPFRMPREVKLPLDFKPPEGGNTNPIGIGIGIANGMGIGIGAHHKGDGNGTHSKNEWSWDQRIRFLDDEETLSFLGYNQQYHQLSYGLRKKLVEDAYSTLNVSFWGGNKVKRKDLSHNIGPQNVIIGLEFLDELDKSIPNFDVPWRRVVISHVDRNLIQSGLRVGDVVTHVDGERFDGNVDKLNFILSSKSSEYAALQRDNGDGYNGIRGGNGNVDGSSSPHISLVVNAEVGVAEALRLRSFMARHQNER